ncbi:hypothetical protein LIER_13348 [Lithospermum erythrorhizon]|uniref:Uncharacterized protein n=1 Tax=Lithospermum erythrorhizon TaxID=34254 RepID=A0AAV3PX35_LITER
MLNTLKERTKAQEAARRAQAELGEPVPLQVIPPPVMSPIEETQQSPLGLEITSDEGEPSNMQDAPKSPTAKESGKDFNPSSEFCDKSGNVEGQNVPSDSPRPEPESNSDEDRPIEVKVSDDDAEVNPPVKPPSDESSHKIDDTQSSQEPTLAKFLSKKKGGRIKRVLRKQGAPVKFVRKPTSPPADTEEDDDIVIVSSTASKRRTRASTAALENKKEKLGLGGESSNTDETVDLDDLEKKAAEKERSRKGKRSAEGKSAKFVSKKRKGTEIPGKGDKFVIDDEESSEEEKKGPRSSKGKLRVNDSRNRINNRRIARGVKETEFDGVEFYGEEHAASLLTTQHPDVLRKEDDIGEDAKSLTISDKLMKGKHVVDIDVSASESTDPVPEGNAAELLIKVYEDKLKVVEAEIQAKSVRASDLRAKISALRVRVTPSVNTLAGTSTSGDGPSSSRM